MCAPGRGRNPYHNPGGLSGDGPSTVPSLNLSSIVPAAEWSGWCGRGISHGPGPDLETVGDGRGCWAVVVLAPLLALLTACLAGWLLFRRLLQGPESAPGPAPFVVRKAGAGPIVAPIVGQQRRVPRDPHRRRNPISDQCADGNRQPEVG